MILTLPPRLGPTRHMRSTILLGSMASLRKAGHFERYQAALAAQHRSTLLDAVAGVWVPIDATLAHYRACESLGLTADAVIELGRSTFRSAEGTLFGAVVRLAKGAGVTPWTVLPQFQRFWDRVADGGGVRVSELGPKDARLDLVQCSIAESPYFRYAMRGVVGAVLQMFCSRVYVQETSDPQHPQRARTPGTMSVRAQWA